MTGRRQGDADGGRPLDYVSVGRRSAPRGRTEVLSERPGSSPREEPSWWEQRWLALQTRRRRRLVVAAAAVVTVALVLGGLTQARAWLSDRAERDLVVLDVNLGVWTSSSTPVGGHVTYYATVRNGGLEPLELTSLLSSDDRLTLRDRGNGPRRLDAGREALVPMSALLTCAPSTAAGTGALSVDVGIRRDDGRTGAQRTALGEAALSVMGFDDHEMASVVDLTTVGQPVREQGEAAARLLLDDLADGVHEPRDVVLPTRLVVRGTTAPPVRVASAR